MCELMGLCFARPVSADFSIREFARRGQDNADGWGLAWYPDQSLALVKEPVGWHSSGYGAFLETYCGLRSSIYVAHVRHKTVGGEPTHADTHPFRRELGGRDYCFAHNGTLNGFREALGLGRFRPVGVTDSEHAFCHLLNEIAHRENGVDDLPGWQWLHAKLRLINLLGTLNCLFSDGRRLYAYHDAAGYKGLTLRKVRVRGPGLRRFQDEEISVELAGEVPDHGIVVATQRLSPTGWHAIGPAELVVLEGGAICYPAHRQAHLAGAPQPSIPME
jgi:glutamine amidotransferase